ncbi:MAG: UDP-N-acetylmuramoyl-L-alanyl-D-glutamate--2,6-diaminopimelate ligase [Dictyoglomaceae bacterium]|nr:UDP-N-acetylmuramoyl-L-alanyl-D-glutamate--2,6-diaminopimelate ligase [Dictyoglomaceae bacterium]
MKYIGEVFEYIKDEIVYMNGKIPEKVLGISIDSREIKEDEIFFAMPGQKEDGKKYIPSAIERGSKVIFYQGEFDEIFHQNVLYIKVKDIYKVLGKVSSWFNDFPSQKLTIIGITGTKGKTTTTHLLYHIWKTKGEKAGLIGTIYNKINDEEIPASFTTPQPPELQSLLKKMVDNGIKYVAMEVSSHALALRRVEELLFDGAVFLNLSQDHLDFHKTMEDYFEAKKKIFNHLKPNGFCILNKDDFWVSKVNILDKKILWFSFNKNADIYPIYWENKSEGLKIKLNTPKGILDLNLKLRGRFNLVNIMSATSVAIALDDDLEIIKRAFESFSQVPGRLEFVEEGQEFSVIVDYAHNPESLLNLLKTVSEFTKGKKILVFGCGGDRDPYKRPIMGEIAGLYSDFVIITSDNPRTEDPLKIIKDIEEGIKVANFRNYIIIENREEAIKTAIDLAKPKDCVIIAGKGHENYQIIGSIKIPFNDKEIARKYIREKLR